jgi:hypothetical protein
MRRARGRDGGDVSCGAGVVGLDPRCETRTDNSKSEIRGFFAPLENDNLEQRKTVSGPVQTADPHSTSLRAGSPLRYASVGMTSSMGVRQRVCGRRKWPGLDRK